MRSSYSMGYDFMAGEYHNINAGAPPFGSRTHPQRSVSLMDNPWGNTPGGDPHPIVANANAEYIPFGAFGSMDPDINSPRVQQWNLMVEQQLGSQLGRVGDLSGQLLRPALGADGAQQRCVPGPGALHAQHLHRSAVLPGLLDHREPEPAARAVAAGSDQVGQDRRARSQLRRRLAEVSRPEAGGAASQRDRREPQRQLHAVEVRGHGHPDHLQSDQRRATRIRTTRNSTPAPATRTARTWGRSTRGTRRRTLATESCTRLRRTGGCRASSARARGARLNITSGRRPRIHRQPFLDTAARPGQR